MAKYWVDGYKRDDGTYVKGHYRMRKGGAKKSSHPMADVYNPAKNKGLAKSIGIESRRAKAERRLSLGLKTRSKYL